MGQRTFGAANFLQEKRQAVRNCLVCRYRPVFQRDNRERREFRRSSIRTASGGAFTARPTSTPSKGFFSPINLNAAFSGGYIDIYFGILTFFLKIHPMPCSTMISERARAAQRGYARSTRQLRLAMKLRSKTCQEK
ncbi:hypothetical protein [Paraburkholderia caribensis]|uniref:hypothetical protein n=1 Tax=Paraburkholderia caribensis TaxID=75105 RepID=UPI0011DF3D42|nr:hypothetical protein [Paraburkholderia caribensis]